LGTSKEKGTHLSFPLQERLDLTIATQALGKALPTASFTRYEDRANPEQKTTRFNEHPGLLVQQMCSIDLLKIRLQIVINENNGEICIGSSRNAKLLQGLHHKWTMICTKVLDTHVKGGKSLPDNTRINPHRGPESCQVKRHLIICLNQVTIL